MSYQYKYLLSLCIPTWNRSKYLELSLRRIYDQYANEEVVNCVELIVSDNCSTDNTKEIVDSYIENGLPIHYSCNNENMGADRNFVKCMQLATGKYIFLLGDDDLLKPDSLLFIVNLLKEKEYGLVHFFFNEQEGKRIIEYDSLDKYFKTISYWYTFMSGNIFRKEVVSIIDAERYVGSYLLQMPFYIESSLLGERNAIVYREIIESGLDAGNNGGYNYYQVFVQNYLSIWREFYESNKIGKYVYKFIKKDIYVKFILGYNIKLLALGEGVKKKNKDLEGRRGGFMIDGAWKILFHNYGNESYFYRSLLSIAYCHFRYVLYKLLNKQV